MRTTTQRLPNAAMNLHPGLNASGSAADVDLGKIDSSPGVDGRVSLADALSTPVLLGADIVIDVARDVVSRLVV